MVLVEQYQKELNLIKVPGGKFTMGDTFGDGLIHEKPVHEVKLSPFFISKYTVTVKQYYEFICNIGNYFNELWVDFINPCFIVKKGNKHMIADGAERFPMVQVSFVGAIAFCNWLSERYGLDVVYNVNTLESDLSRNGFRLLTEAEWEYACSGYSNLKYSVSNVFDSKLINYKYYDGEHVDLRAGYENIGGFGLTPNSPLPVGTLPPNEFGIHEMIGNVNEWCNDKYGNYSQLPTENPTGHENNSFRVIRGGCFNDDMNRMRKCHRHAIHPEAKCMIDGFRIGKNNY